MKMNYRMLGDTGISVSEIGMGCEGFSEDETRMAKNLFDEAERLGINFFDLYAPNPDMRKAVGRALTGRREKFVIQAHLCAIWKHGQYLRTRNLKDVKAAFEEMLQLLDVTYVDIGMIHYCDSMDDWNNILKNGILDYARELKAEGKIKQIGLSSHNPQVALEAIQTGDIKVLMFSVNPCYDLQPASENVEDIWADESYEGQLTNMDPERQRLYERCEELGVGITVMKAFGGGDLLDESLSPAGKAMTVNECIAYALSRPAVSSILCGAKSVEELQVSAAYETASDAEKDYASVLATFPKISWEGHCMYCNHCLPCPSEINIADVTKFYHLTVAQHMIPETVREHYKSLTKHASDCISCGVCESRCPFHVEIRNNMRCAKETFGY